MTPELLLEHWSVPAIVVVLLVLGVVPQLLLRLTLWCYPKGHDRRAELLAEFAVVAQAGRLLWVLDVLTAGIFDGLLLRRRARSARACIHPEIVRFRVLMASLLLAGSTAILNEYLPDWTTSSPLGVVMLVLLGLSLGSVVWVVALTSNAARRAQQAVADTGDQLHEKVEPR